MVARVWGLFAVVRLLVGGWGCAGDPSTYEELCELGPSQAAMGVDRPFGGEPWVSAELPEAQQRSVWAAARAWTEATGGRVRWSIRRAEKGDHTIREGAVTVFACPRAEGGVARRFLLRGGDVAAA